MGWVNVAINALWCPSNHPVVSGRFLRSLLKSIAPKPCVARCEDNQESHSEHTPRFGMFHCLLSASFSYLCA